MFRVRLSLRTCRAHVVRQSSTQQILQEFDPGVTIESFRTKLSIKIWVTKVASKTWWQEVQESKCLAATYARSRTLKFRGYLKEDFGDRQLLTKLRIDDLDLSAAGLNAKQSMHRNCSWCQREPETRGHFVLKCEALRHVRLSHGIALKPQGPHTLMTA